MSWFTFTKHSECGISESSAVRPHHQVEVVNNEISKRRTAAVVGHVNGERLLGEAAASVNSRFPQTVVSRARDMLGKSALDEDLKAMLGSNYLPYDISDDANKSSIRLSVGPEESYIAEELVVSAAAVVPEPCSKGMQLGVSHSMAPTDSPNRASRVPSLLLSRHLTSK